MNFTEAEINHATAFDLSIAGTPVLNFDADGMDLVSGKNKNWFDHLLGSNFAVGGNGAVAQAVLSIGASRKYNAFELPNGGTDPFLETTFWLPPDYDAASISLTFYLVKTATATGTNIVTRCRLGCAGSGDSLDLSITSPDDTTTAVGANNTLFTVTHALVPTNAADGGLCHGFFQRVPTSVNDDYTGSIYLLGARVRYT